MKGKKCFTKNVNREEKMRDLQMGSGPYIGEYGSMNVVGGGPGKRNIVTVGGVMIGVN